MEYLQYGLAGAVMIGCAISFKPCYKWNTFNTSETWKNKLWKGIVLNLVISGIPSIRYRGAVKPLC